MFKLPKPPSPRAGIHELADYAELRCWIETVRSKQTVLSASSIVRYLVQAGDNELQSGCDDDEDAARELVGDVMDEIGRRSEACRGGYPFKQEHRGQVLRYVDPRRNARRERVYLYLLLSTRLNMKQHGRLSGIDGALLLEELSACVLRSYLGSGSHALVLGTSAGGTLGARIDELCKRLREGDGFNKHSRSRRRTGDGGADTVGWVPFADGEPGQLIVFGQAKTGTEWKDGTTKLQPPDFVKKWMNSPILVDPLKAFFVSESINRGTWRNISIDSGILFDRCRLVEHSENIPWNVFNSISKWTTMARNTVMQSTFVQPRHRA